MLVDARFFRATVGHAARFAAAAYSMPQSRMAVILMAFLSLLPGCEHSSPLPAKKSVASDALPVHRDPNERLAEEGDLAALEIVVAPWLSRDADLKSDPASLKWLEMAARAGMAQAQFRLGSCLYFGELGDKDERAGTEWVKQAANQGHPEACGLLGLCCLEGSAVEQDYSAAVMWLKRALAMNEVNAAFGLAMCYENGWGTRKDEAEAFTLYRRAAREGVVAAQLAVSRCYTTGMGTESKPAEAFNWIKKAAEAGDTRARLLLAKHYQDGFGTQRNPAKAARLYRELAEEGYATAQLAFAGFCFRGEGVTRDYAEGGKWLQMAARQGNGKAQELMAVMFVSGEGVPRNLVAAYAWASLAAAQGVGDSVKMLDEIEERMTREQVAEAQRMAAEFTARLAEGDKADRRPVAAETSPKYGSGSGFFVTADGYFVTSHHVIEDAQRIKVKTAEGVYNAEVVRVDVVNDLAVLKVVGTFTALPVRGSGRIKLADRVATVGFPNPGLQGVSPKYSSGEVAALTGAGDDPRYIQISVPVQPGNSGGALVDMSGCVVGVVAARLDEQHAVNETGSSPENVNYAVKGSIVLNLLESIADVRPASLRSAGAIKASAADVARVAEAACGMGVVER
jgi:TPR repeat protein